MSIQSPTTSAIPRVDTHSSRVDVINTKQGRILCVADVRGALSTLNTLAAEHNAIAIIHSGDFGFYEPSSIPSISDRTLKHLLQYSSLLTPQFRSQLLSPSTSPTQLRQLLQNSPDFVLSEFPKLLSGELRFNVPVYTVWGACEDVSILEKIRLAPNPSLSIPDSTPSLAPSTTTQSPSSSSEAPSYSIPNLTVLDEATTRVLVIGGVRLRLFGLGGAVVSHKLFDNGQGNATIAGGMGTMWTTMLQIGELVDTAQKVYDPTETRLLLTHASPGREGLISQLSLVLKADLTISAGLHFRYGVSYNEFSVNWDPESFRGKLEASRKAFGEVWDAVKNQVEGVVDENQKSLLANALAVANRVPATAPVAGGPAAEETAWKNCWNWNLPDAAFGSLVLDIREGRIGSEMKSQGFNFAYRSSSSSSTQPSTSAPRPTQPQPQPQPQQPSAPQPQQNMNRPQPVPAAAPPASTSTAPHTVQGVGRGAGIHQRGPSGAMRVGGNRIGFSNYQAAPPSSNSAPQTSESETAPPSIEPKQNGNVPESKPTPSPSSVSPAPPASANSSAPPTGPRNQQNRPPSRQQQQNPSPPPAQSSSPAPPTPAQPEPSSTETPAKPSESQTIETPGEPSNGENATGSIGRSSGRGRGRGGRGRGDGVDRGERSERGGATPGRGNRGRSNGEWRGRGRGGARQASGEVGSATPTATPGGGGGGGEKPSA